MRFEFLAPDAAEPFEGSVPVMRSPIEWSHRDAGAQFSERAGWRFVADYGNPTAEAAACERSVGVADLSPLGKLELQGAPDDVAAVVAEVAGGARLTLGSAVLHEGTWWCPVTAGRVLGLTPPEATGDVRERLEAAGSEAFLTVVELTTALSSNAVAGPLARETFARSTALDMRPKEFGEGAFAPVSVARVPGMVLRTGPDRFLHLFGSGYAHYVWTVFVDAAEHLGGRAVGIDAVPEEAPAHA